jgi:Fe-S cluster assembly protein SufD
MITEENAYAAQFETLRERLPGRGLGWLDRLRGKGIDDFLALGFPTTKLENWKYMNVAPIRRTTFKPAVHHPVTSLPEELRLEINSYGSARLVFINGRFDPTNSPPQPRRGGAQRRGGVGQQIGFLGRHHPSRGCTSAFPSSAEEGSCCPLKVLSLSEALRDQERASIIEVHLGRYTSTSDHAFAAWNTAFFTDGAYIEIPLGFACVEPIHLVYVSAENNEPWASHPRNLIVAREGSQVSIVESFIGSNDVAYLNNVVTEIVAEPGALIRYYKVERESPHSFHVSVTNAELDRDACFTSFSISFGGALVRNDLNVSLAGEGSHCTLNGLFMVDGQRLVDNHTRIEHLKPHASSRELYKGVLAGNAEGVFNGAIAVHENARKTDAVQYSKNLLLSKQAQINTNPQLEIRNNDVRCFHGATIGQIDTDAIFYLKSRGIDEGEAKRILIRGFAGEVVDAISVSTLRNQLKRLLDDWLSGVGKPAGSKEPPKAAYRSDPDGGPDANKSLEES